MDSSKTIATSFASLSKEKQTQVNKLFSDRKNSAERYAKSGSGGEKIKEELRKVLFLDTKELAQQRTVLPTLLAYYSGQLAATNPVIFEFIKTEEQKARLRNQLLFTFYLLYAQYQLDIVEGRNYTLKAHEDALDLCAQRLEELQIGGKKDSGEKDLEKRIADSGKYLKYLGMLILAPWFVTKMQEFSEGKTVALRKWMDEINGKRLYWVWGGGMLASILDMLPDDFFNKLQAQQGLAIPAPITGYMSWVLYYARFGINLLLLLKHTIRGPWMSAEESKIPVWERFQTQWQQRKFTLLNDSIWATANMLCFFWLKGSGMLGYAGNVLTTILLVMDLTVATWKYWEESTQHNANMLAFKRDRKELEKRRGDLTDELGKPEANIASLQAQLKDIAIQIEQLDKMESKTEFDWKYKRYGLINDWMYALGLMLAFCVLCTFFFPPTAIVPATAMLVSTIGAAMCFILTVAYAAISGGIDIAKSRETSKQLEDDYTNLFAVFKNETDDNRKKQLCLEMKGLLAESDYQQQVASFQAIKLLRSTLIDTLIPPLVFASLMFLSLGIGLSALAAGFALVMISNTIINRFEPQAQELPTFNGADYTLLLKSENATDFKTQNKFFSGTKKSSYFRLFSTCMGERQEDSIPLTAILS